MDCGVARACLASDKPGVRAWETSSEFPASVRRLDNEIENFDPLRPILDASLTTPVTYAVNPGDITYGLFSVPKVGPGCSLMTPFLISSSVTVAAVPEPASWTMMLVGVGAIGGLVRKSRGQGRQVAHAR